MPGAAEPSRAALPVEAVLARYGTQQCVMRTSQLLVWAPDEVKASTADMCTCCCAGGRVSDHWMKAYLDSLIAVMTVQAGSKGLPGRGWVGEEALSMNC